MQVRLVRSILVACAVFALAGAAYAGSITVFNTGVTAGGVSAADGSVGLHYTLTPPSGSTAIRVRTSVGGSPITGPPWGWIGDNSTSAWIGPNNANDLTSPVGDYTYTTTFDLTGMNISSARLTGWWAADDYGVDILLNGNATSNPNPWWNAWLGFTITSGFVQTTNTLSFVVHNSGQAANPTGLRVDNLSLTANAIPEPASFVLLAAGLGVLMALRRRRLV